MSTDQHIILKDGRKLGFAEYGKRDGHPIIYCHGSQSSRLEMHYDMSFARDNNLRIITIDRPGHGLSDFNPNGSILNFAKDVKELTESLKIDTFSVAGMSAGSPFALGIGYLFSKNVQNISIISGFAPYNSESKSHLSKAVKIMLSLAKNFPFLLRTLLKIQAKQLATKPQKKLQGFLKIMSAPDQEVLKNKSVMHVIEKMFVEAFKSGSQGVAYEISNLLVREWNFELNKIQVLLLFGKVSKITMFLINGRS